MTQQDNKNSKWIAAASIVFWLLVWQAAGMAVGEELFLPSPLSVVKTLGSLVVTASFWSSVARSLLRISFGFFLGLAAGVLLAWAAAASKIVDALLRPLMQLVRAIPVASFVILALVWISSKNLSVFTSFLMVLPVIYGGTLSGIESTDASLLEMASVFKVPFRRKLYSMYLPAVMPSLLSACQLALGLCWKSGVAAEVIGLPRGTIGERLHQAKIYLMTPELFAWTFVIIVISWAFSRLFLWLFTAAATRLERGTLA